MRRIAIRCNGPHHFPTVGVRADRSKEIPIMSSWFSRWSSRIATISGYWQTFVIMTGICLVWALSGPLFNYSDTWQLVINTATTVLTFLMVFLIQNTQNRDSVAVHLKLDEIIRAIDEADDKIMAAEDADDQ